MKKIVIVVGDGQVETVFSNEDVEVVEEREPLEIVENYCCDHYGTCEITKVEEIRK